MYKMLEEMAIAGSSDEQLVAAAKKAFGFSPTLREIKRVKANVRPVRFRGGADGALPNLSLNDVLNRQAMEKASRRFVARLCVNNPRRLISCASRCSIVFRKASR
jgi:hypothetical protein